MIRPASGATLSLVIHHTGTTSTEQLAAVESNHESRGYDASVYGSHVAYHFFIGTDGTIVQNRALSERTYHTRNTEVNDRSIAIVLAGDFNASHPSPAQLESVRNLVERLDAIYSFHEIIGHREASPTGCPGKYLTSDLHDLWRYADGWEVWRITRYYTPTIGQSYYFSGSYEEDFKINCSGDCRVTAAGYHLEPEDAFKVAACPPEIPFGARIEIEGIGIVTCQDRGGAIKDKRLDVWAGIGPEAQHWMKIYPGHYLRIRFL